LFPRGQKEKKKKKFRWHRNNGRSQFLTFGGEGVIVS